MRFTPVHSPWSVLFCALFGVRSAFIDLEPTFFIDCHEPDEVDPGGAIVITPWTGETPQDQSGQGTRLRVDHQHLRRLNAALLVEDPPNGWLTMGNTAQGDPGGAVLMIFHHDRREDQGPRLMVFIPMEVPMSVTRSPMRHSLLYTRLRYFRRVPANVFVYTAAYVRDADWSHWKGS